MSEPPEIRIDFWDVGQADCTVITLPDSSLIIIDVGGKGSPLVDWLNERRSPADIFAIILTHNHADHAGALCSIVAEHKRRIGAVWMLADRDASDFRENAVFRCAEQAESEGHFRVRGLFAGQTIWQDNTIPARLKVIYPSFTENIRATSPNQACGLIALETDSARLIAWPGDLDIQRVAQKCAAVPPWLLDGPHHGGPTDIKSDKEAAMNAVKALAPRRAFVSVGTRNSYHHPRPRYLRTLGRSGCHVVCSQLTQRCEMEQLARREHVMQGSGLLGLRPARSGVSCRGSWRVTLRHGRLVPDQWDAVHLDRISKLKRPQCLLGRGWHRGQPLPGAIV